MAKEINQPVISVSELNRLVKGELEAKFPNLWIEGEISNLAQPGSGHIYFTLKDETAQVRCAMFRLQNRLLTFRVENGLKVKIKAKVSLYEGRGDYQLIVSRMIPDGEGALQQAFEALKKQLSSEGLFKEDHKQEIPQFPDSIGLITSPTGAVIQDMLHVIDRRFPGITVNIYPTQVQGKQALPYVLKALKLAIEHGESEVLILARGGGSLEDLWAFNEEKLARAIYQCPIPIISAIGHETDVTIADFVADVRAPTPSAAAEIATPDRDEWLEHLEILNERLIGTIMRIIQNKSQQLDWLSKRLQHPKARLQAHNEKLMQCNYRLTVLMNNLLSQSKVALSENQFKLQSLIPLNRIQQSKLQVHSIAALIANRIEFILATRKQKISGLARALDGVSPLATLSRGYCVVSDFDSEKIITSVQEIEKGQIIRNKLKDGMVDSEVKGVVCDLV